MIAGTLIFSVLFVVLLIPLGIIGYKFWRLMKTAQQRNAGQATSETITAQYTVIADTEPNNK